MRLQIPLRPQQSLPALRLQRQSLPQQPHQLSVRRQFTNKTNSDRGGLQEALLLHGHGQDGLHQSALRALRVVVLSQRGDT